MRFFGRPAFIAVTSVQLSGNLALGLTIGMGEGVFQSLCRSARKSSKHLGLGGIATSSSSLTEDNFTNREPFPTIPSHQQSQYQKCNLYKICVSSFMGVPACGAHLFVFLT